MSALSVPFSASQHRARASNKYAASEASTATESDDGTSAARGHVTEKSAGSAHAPTTGITRQESKRQSLPALQPIPAQKPSPLRRRSSPSPYNPMKKQTTKTLTKNYVHMIKDFNAMKKYAKQPNGEYLPTTLCAFCETSVPRLVFLPCQHRCVCDRCLIANDITNEPTSATSWTACPVCLVDIKLMLPHTGNEEAMYWKWALEFPPMLPDNFRDDFRDTAKRLRRGSSAVQPESSTTVVPATNSMMRKSEPHADTIPSAGGTTLGTRPSRSRGSISGSQHSTRRFSLVYRRGSAVGSAGAEDRSKCSIL